MTTDVIAMTETEMNTFMMVLGDSDASLKGVIENLSFGEYLERKGFESAEEVEKLCGYAGQLESEGRTHQDMLEQLVEWRVNGAGQADFVMDWVTHEGDNELLAELWCDCLDLEDFEDVSAPDAIETMGDSMGLSVLEWECAIDWLIDTKGKEWIAGKVESGLMSLTEEQAEYFREVEA